MHGGPRRARGPVGCARDGGHGRLRRGDESARVAPGTVGAIRRVRRRRRGATRNHEGRVRRAQPAPPDAPAAERVRGGTKRETVERGGRDAETRRARPERHRRERARRDARRVVRRDARRTPETRREVGGWKFRERETNARRRAADATERARRGRTRRERRRGERDALHAVESDREQPRSSNRRNWRAVFRIVLLAPIRSRHSYTRRVRADADVRDATRRRLDGYARARRRVCEVRKKENPPNARRLTP